MNDLARLLWRLEATARANGYDCAEVWEPVLLRPVWLEASRDERGRVGWKLDERRIARSAIEEALRERT